MSKQDPESRQKKQHHRITIELAILLGLLAAGFWLVPATVYLTGEAVLGPYGDDQGMGRFYLDLFARLVEGDALAWLLVSALYLTLLLLRILIWIWRTANRDRPRETPTIANGD